MSPDAVAIPYNKVLSNGGISCVSATSGLTCTNGKGHGFFVSRAKQRVF